MDYSTINMCVYSSFGTDLDIECKQQFSYVINEHSIYDINAIITAKNMLAVNAIQRDTRGVIKRIAPILTVPPMNSERIFDRDALCCISTYFRRNIVFYDKVNKAFFYIKQYDTASAKAFQIIDYDEMIKVMETRENRREQIESKVVTANFNNVSRAQRSNNLCPQLVLENKYLLEIKIKDGVMQEYFPGTRLYVRMNDDENMYLPFVRVYINSEGFGNWLEIYHNVRYMHLLKHEKDAILYNHIYNPRINLNNENVKILELLTLRVDRRLLYNEKNLAYKMNNSAHKYLNGTLENRSIDRRQLIMLDDKLFYDDRKIKDETNAYSIRKRVSSFEIMKNGLKPAVNVNITKANITFGKMIGKIYVMIGNDLDDVSDELGAEIVLYHVKNLNTLKPTEDELYNQFYVYYNGPQLMPYELQQGINIFIHNNINVKDYYTHNGINCNIDGLMNAKIKNAVFKIIEFYLKQTIYIDKYGIQNMDVYDEINHMNASGIIEYKPRHEEIIMRLSELVIMMTPSYMLNNMNFFNRNNTFRFDCMPEHINENDNMEIKRISLMDFVMPCGMIVEYSTGYLNYHRCMSYILQVDKDNYGFDCRCGRKYRYPELRKYCREMICRNFNNIETDVESDRRYRKRHGSDKHYINKLI